MRSASPTFVEQFAGTSHSRCDIAAGELVRQKHVLFRGQGRDQLIRLKHEADLSAAHQC